MGTEELQSWRRVPTACAHCHTVTMASQWGAGHHIPVASMLQIGRNAHLAVYGSKTVGLWRLGPGNGLLRDGELPCRRRACRASTSGLNRGAIVGCTCRFGPAKLCYSAQVFRKLSRPSLTSQSLLTTLEERYARVSGWWHDMLMHWHMELKSLSSRGRQTISSAGNYLVYNHQSIQK